MITAHRPISAGDRWPPSVSPADSCLRASAVVLLLGAVAIGKPWFGVALVFAFGVGMSVALVAAGLVALRVTTAGMSRLRRRIDLPARLVPTAAGLVVTAVGVFLFWDGARTLI